VKLGSLAALPLLVAAAGLLAGLPAHAAAFSARDAFAQADQLEQAGELLAAAHCFQEAAESGRHAGYWRAARATWRYADRQGQEKERIELFRRAAGLAGRGLESEPHCGPCALWRYASLGRLTQELGWMWAGRHAREMAALLDLGIAQRPTHRDADGNSTLANLYYARAVFYRMVPEWWWLGLVFGVRGNTGRALHDIRSALHISPQRIDYNVEYGAVLLCDASRHDRPARLREGRSVLRRALHLSTHLVSDAVDQGFAHELLDHPEQACGWSRKGFIDVEGEGRALAQQARAD